MPAAATARNRTKRSRRLALALPIATIALAAVPLAADAATLTPTVLPESGTQCSLRHAIDSANANADSGSCVGSGAYGDDVIELPGGVYTLNLGGAGDNANVSGDLDVAAAGSLAITHAGSGQATINASALGDRVIDVLAGANLSLSGLTVRGGSTAGAADGGGISNQGTLSVSNSTVTDNHAGDAGGGLDVSGPTTLTNVTISGNDANNNGGAIRKADATTVMIESSTITANVADADANAAGDGGGLYSLAGTIFIRNTILAGNLVNAGGFGPECHTVESLGNSLIGLDGDCFYEDGPGDTVGVPPQLGPLELNGGLTATHALAPTSPAINAGAGCPATDQRGVARPQGPACDIGAFELEVAAVEPPAAPHAAGDTTAPETSITKLKRKRAKRKATLRFDSSEAGSSFTCKLDRRPQAPCSSPAVYKRLKPGRHTFTVAATDAAGNVDLSPASRRFKVKRPTR